MTAKSTQTNASIVFCHGLWADGSCFSKLIVPLQAEGYECIAAQYGLNTTAEDVALVKATIGRVSDPVILVGHSYGGSVITGAGVDDRVAGLVYICALAPDADETSQTQQSNFPKTDVFSHIEVVDGRIWLRPEGTKYFCGPPSLSPSSPPSSSATPTAEGHHGAGTDERVAGLVYIAALAPDADERRRRQQDKFPTTDVFAHIEVADGRIWMRPEGIDVFCGDLSEQEQKLVWATQGVPQPDLFDAKVGGTAWKSKPSWYIVGKKDHTVHPDLERAMAKRMGATTYELDSSHVPMLSQPERVIDVIRTAAKAVQGATAAA